MLICWCVYVSVLMIINIKVLEEKLPRHER